MTTAFLHLLASVGPGALVVLMAVAFAETGVLAGFLLPGDSLMFSAGALVASHALHLPVVLTIAAVTLAAVAGDQVGYLLGRRFGPRLLNRPGGRFRSTAHLEHARAFFARHGPRAVVLARFVPLVRTLTPVVAGMGRMPRGRFAAYNLVGAAAWSCLTLGGGYWFASIPLVSGHLGLVAIGLVVLSVLPVAVPVLRSLLRRTRGSGLPVVLPVERALEQPAA